MRKVSWYSASIMNNRGNVAGAEAIMSAWVLPASMSAAIHWVSRAIASSGGIAPMRESAASKSVNWGAGSLSSSPSH